MCVVTLLGLVFDVCDRNGDTTLTLFWRLVDLIEWGEWIYIWILIVQHLRNRSGKSGLTVVNVTNGSDVDVWFGSLELCLCHFGSSFLFSALFLLLGY